MKRRMKRYPFLIAIFVSVLLFSVIGLLGKNTIYADYDVGLLKKPLLSVVFQGMGDGYYPWQMITYSGETVKNAFADSEENVISSNISDFERADLASNTDNGNLQNSPPADGDSTSSSSIIDNTTSSRTVNPSNPTEAASSKDITGNASNISTTSQTNEGLDSKTSDQNKNIDENTTTTEALNSETNETMNQNQTTDYTEDSQEEEGANDAPATGNGDTQSSDSNNNTGNGMDTDTDATGNSNIDTKSTTTANGNNNSATSNATKTTSSSITPNPKDGNTSDKNLQNASASNSNTSDTTKSNLDTANADSTNTNKTNTSKSNSDTSSSTGTTKQGAAEKTQSNKTTTTTSKDKTTSDDKTAAKDKTTSDDKTASKDEATLITYSYETVTKEYFDDALFIGDSRTVGLSEYSELTNATYYADVGLSIYDIFKDKIAEVNGKKYTVKDALKKKQFKKIYIMLGINELGTGTADSFTEEYEDAITEIKKLQPDAIIFVQAIMTVSKEMSDKDKVFNNKNIKERNEHLATLADNNSIFYIDVNEDITDETGGIPSKYTFDNIHLKAAYYKIWQDFLLDHGIVIK